MSNTEMGSTASSNAAKSNAASSNIHSRPKLASSRPHAEISRPLLVADVGNSAVKIGRVATWGTHPAERSIQVLGQITSAHLGQHAWHWDLPAEPVTWRVVSVAPPVLEQMQAWVEQHRPSDTWRTFNYRSLPLRIDVEHPERVGADRLAAAVGANVCRQSDANVIVIDAGTAVTVDIVDRAGTFQGGLILPGPRIAARALASNTAQLPDVHFDPDDVPALVGKNTVAAIRGGIYWGWLGALDFLVQRMSASLDGATQVMVTGGAMAAWADKFSQPVQLLPDLVLLGVAEAAAQEGSMPDAASNVPADGE